MCDNQSSGGPYQPCSWGKKNTLGFQVHIKFHILKNPLGSPHWLPFLHRYSHHETFHVLQNTFHRVLGVRITSGYVSFLNYIMNSQKVAWFIYLYLTYKVKGQWIYVENHWNNRRTMFAPLWLSLSTLPLLLCLSLSLYVCRHTSTLLVCVLFREN